MADNAGAERAIAALDQAEIDGRTITVRFAEDMAGGAGTPNHTASKPPKHVAIDATRSMPKRKRPRLPKR
ncbi:hypothetical protein IDJ77_16190 [Mucilaginibacter sp. ZT4R22]|uniref:RNA recognition motif-containing protein n=1 Tax=Mucilaginibacter pankratovii TaxID=2772110 RepID=A0ABR7WST5_9SPHI|nr:hypothetical protein [Mucilaginibacter pankratovii]